VYVNSDCEKMHGDYRIKSCTYILFSTYVTNVYQRVIFKAGIISWLALVFMAQELKEIFANYVVFLQPV
jgi:hypothetical protein